MATRPSHGLLWGALFRVEPGRPAIGAGLRVAAGITVPLAIGLGTNRLTMGSAAAIGALNVGMADSGGPERTRVASMSAAAIANAGVFALGIVSAGTLGAAAPLMFAIAFASGLGTLYGRAASIVGFVTTVVFTLGLGFPPGAVSGPEAVWLSLVGGAWAMILALALWPLRPYGQRRTPWPAATWRSAGLSPRRALRRAVRRRRVGPHAPLATLSRRRERR